jgi:hypothetical protein
MIEAHPVTAVTGCRDGGKRRPRGIILSCRQIRMNYLPCAGSDPSGPALGDKKEIIMSTILRSALVAVALIASASASMAAPRHHHGYASYQSDNYGHEDARTFFDNQQRYGN